MAVAFALFRVFDILKPFPCDRCERLPTGLGIMADDWAAAAYAAAILAAFRAAGWL
jgi:phosphatidylglycerophosphatase A